MIWGDEITEHVLYNPDTDKLVITTPMALPDEFYHGVAITHTSLISAKSYTLIYLGTL